MLGRVFTQHENGAQRFNACAAMGFVIVPAQPFGFNYLGGKLLAAICTTHEVRKMLDEKYKMTTCLFETTSLYGRFQGSITI
jgi:F0F1-type ATP synthase membrane subunit c/vacuolar-type H+-ATPase subunit K